MPIKPPYNARGVQRAGAKLGSRRGGGDTSRKQYNEDPTSYKVDREVRSVPIPVQKPKRNK